MIDEKYSYDDETLFKKFKKVSHDEGIGGVILLNYLTFFIDIVIESW